MKTRTEIENEQMEKLTKEKLELLEKFQKDVAQVDVQIRFVKSGAWYDQFVKGNVQ